MAPALVSSNEPTRLADVEAAAKAFNLPIGAASPLWFVFAGAASVGVAYWWMTRWTRPSNLEAWYGSKPEAPEPAAPKPVLTPDPALPPIAVGGESAPLAGAPAEAVKAAAEDVAKAAEPARPAAEVAPLKEPVSFKPPEPKPEPAPAKAEEALKAAQATLKADLASKAAAAPKSEPKAEPAKAKPKSVPTPDA